MYFNELDNTQPSFPLNGRPNGFPSAGQGLNGNSDIAALRAIAQKYCPEEVKSVVSPIVPSEIDEFNFSEIEKEFTSLLHGGAPSSNLLGNIYFDDDSPSSVSNSHSDDANTNSIAAENGFGIGIPETELVKNLKYEEVDTANTDEIRKQFPILNQKVNGHDLIWFDNGATTQKPLRVIDGLSEFYKHDYSNIHRGAHTLAARSTDQYEAAREKVARFINAPSQENIVFVRGTTEGINLVAQTFGRKYVEAGDNVIVSTLDHHANIVPWQQICRERNAELRAIPIDKNGDLILSELERLITPRTKFISVGHVNNTFGTINDVETIIKIAHSHNIPVLIDGAQSIAHTRVDVQQLDCDFFVFSGHKIYGPSGIGVVYGKKEMLELLPPWQGGGNMIKDVTIERTEFNDPPARFEAGTPNIADAIGLGYALDFVSSVGIDNIERHEHDLTEYARQQISRISGITIMGDPKKRVSVISLDVHGIPVPVVGKMLDQEGIAVRAGHHCAQPALRALGYEMSVRPTFAVYNTREEIDRLVSALEKIVSSNVRS